MSDENQQDKIGGSTAISSPPPPPFKLKIGRPSKYNPKCCDEVLELGAQGASIAQIAVHFGVHRESIFDWAKAHPDFSAALKRAFDLSQSWWELYGRSGQSNPGFNALVWKKTMEARFRNDYTERRENVVTGPNGGPLQINAPQVIDVEALHPDDLETLKVLLLAARDGIEDADEP